MFVAFYKPTTIKGKLVAWWTGGDFSHCELVFTKSLPTPWNYYLCFAALPWQGVRFRWFMYDERWTFVEWDLETRDAKRLSDFCQREKYTKYDWLGIFRFVFPFLGQSRKRWFCSELVVAALAEAGWRAPEQAHLMNVNRLFDVLVKDTVSLRDRKDTVSFRNPMDKP